MRVASLLMRDACPNVARQYASVLGLVVVRVCIALQWAVCLAVRESHVARARGMWRVRLAASQ